MNLNKYFKPQTQKEKIVSFIAIILTIFFTARMTFFNMFNIIRKIFQQYNWVETLISVVLLLIIMCPIYILFYIIVSKIAGKLKRKT